jgi:site-specific DNA recombinase
VCVNAQKRGWSKCPAPSIPAAEIERFVVDQIRGIGRDPDLIRATILQTKEQSRARLGAHDTELRDLERELARWNAEVRDVAAQVGPSGDDSPALARLADLQERIRGAERRATVLREHIRAVGSPTIDDQQIAEALSRFDPLWDSLTPREQSRVIELLVERVDYDGTRGKVAVTFHPEGIKSFGDEFASTDDAA